MPGTLATLATVPIIYFLSFTSVLWYVIIAIACNVVGVYLCDKTSKDFGVHDPSAIVWDEMAAFLLTMIAIPFTWINITIAFVLFRVLDIVKPFPISWVDKNVRGGLGIMLDDIIAALVTLLIIHFIQFFV